MSLNSSLKEPTSAMSRLLTEHLANVDGLLLKSVSWSGGALRGRGNERRWFSGGGACRPCHRSVPQISRGSVLELRCLLFS